MESRNRLRSFRRKMRSACEGLGWALALVAGLQVTLRGYDNDNKARTMTSGPHRTINKLAIDQFFATLAKDPILARYDLKGAPQLLGEAVATPGLTLADCIQGDKSGSFRWWVEEGAYTADEPEWYASFRHFYDPLAVNGGATWLTDHLDDLGIVWSACAPNIAQLLLGTRFNPRIDAMTWALEGPAGDGMGENRYCLKRGVGYMKEAFASTKPDKQRLFAKAWRALGETMHLMADMTSVPHVRNDSHPGMAIGALGFGNYNANVGIMKADPYESMTRESLIESLGKGAVDPVVGSRIKAARTPEELFRSVATYTQSHFFSADTLSGTDHLGRAVTPANGMPAYPAPKLEPTGFNPQTGYYTKQIFNRPVRLTHETWLGANGWGDPMHATQISYACVQDQAAILLPIAVAANARLIEMVLPRVEVKLASFDPVTKVLHGQVLHRPSGVHSTAMTFNSGPSQFFNLWVDGSLQDWNRVKLTVVGNQITADLKGLELRSGQKVRLGLDVGGIMVRSVDLPVKVDEPVKPKTPAAKGAAIQIVISGLAKYDQSYQDANQNFVAQRWASWENRDVIPISYSGSSFSGSRRDAYGTDEVVGTVQNHVVRDLTWKGTHLHGTIRKENWEIVLKDVPLDPGGAQRGGNSETFMVRVWMGGMGLPWKQQVMDPGKHIPTFKHQMTFLPSGRTANLLGVDWIYTDRSSVLNPQSAFILVTIYGGGPSPAKK